MDDLSDDRNERKRKGDNSEGSSADTKTPLDGVEWLRQNILDSLEINNRARDGKIEEILSWSTEREILKAIINLREINILKHLTQNVQDFIFRVNLDLWIELINLTAENEFFEIFIELKKFEEVYEKNSHEESSKRFKIDYEYKNVLSDVLKLHGDISSGQLSDIKIFNDKYPKLKLCHDSQNVSALEKSIEAKKFEIYPYLRANGFYSDNNQTLQAKIKSLNYEEKEELRVEISKFTFNDPIGLILTKCELDACNDVINFRDIREMLDTLIKIKEVKPVLEILAQSDVRIIFDYKEESVMGMDPTKDEFSFGMAYFNRGILYVGRNRSRAQRFGTFAHEATHFALFLLYENRCLPYREKDEKREREWEGIVENIRQNYEADPIGTDNIIKWVYQLYEPGFEHNAELIVRVNDLLAFYHENPQKCEEVRETYAQLFNFYRDRVLPDLNTKNVYKIIKLNNDLELFDNIVDSNFQVQSSENFHLLEFKENIRKACESFNEGTSRDLKRFNEINQKVQNLPHKNFLFLSDVPQMTLSKLFNEISQKTSNKLHIKAKNIFIDFEKLSQKSLMKELEEILTSSDILRILLCFDDVDKKIEKNFELLCKIKPSVEIFVVAHLNCDGTLKTLNNFFKIEGSKIEIEGEVFKIIEDSKTKTSDDSHSNLTKLLKVSLKHSWLELTEESKEKVLKSEIKICGESLKLGDIFEVDAFPSAETLKILSSQSEFEIKLKEPGKLDSFITRKVLMKNNDPWPSTKTFEEFIDESEREKIVVIETLKKFIDEAETDKIVVISDLAGSGKTTLLQKIHENLKRKFQNFWIPFVILREHIKLLEDSLQIGENFLEIMSEKILKLNELERKIFELKYERNEVVILFDGFDEISPTCKKNSLKIFKLHKESGKSQIWVTTRTHLEHDIESALDVKAHAIKSLTEAEQIKFLCEFWQESCDNSNLREKCAKLLVKEMTKMSEEFPNLIGIILQLRLLGERFKNELSKDFEEKIKNLNIFEVYEYLAQSCSKFKEQNSIHNIFKYQTSSYEAFALKNILGDKFHHLFGRTLVFADFEHDKDALEEFTKGGIIRFDKDGKVYFLHRTVDEFFVSRFVKNRIKSFKPNWQYEEDFFWLLFEILSNEFSIVKQFLDNSLSNFEEEIAQGEYKNFQKCLVKFVNESLDFNFKIFAKVFYEGLSVISFFVLKCIKRESAETFKKIIKGCRKKGKNGNISHCSVCVERTRDLELLGKFLDEVFSSFDDDSELFDLLMQENDERKTVFHEIAQYEESFETFKKFWLKVEERNFEYEKVLKFFSSRDEEGKIFFSFTESYNFNFFFSYIFDFKNFFDGNSCKVTEILRRNLETEDGRKIFSEKEFRWWESFVDDEQNFKDILEFTRKVFDSEDLMTKLEEFDQKEVKRSFMEAVIRSIGKVFVLAFDESQNLKNEEIFNFSLKKEIWSQSFLRVYGNFSEIFELIFDKVHFKVLNFKEFAFEVDENDELGQNIFHLLASYGNVEKLEIFMTRARTEMTDEEFKNYIKIKKKYGGNALMCSALNDNFEVFRFLFEEVYLKVLKFKELAYEVDKHRQNVFHLLVSYGNVEKLKNFLDRAQIELSREELKKFLKINMEGSQNIFHLAAQNWINRNEVVEFLIEFVEKLLTTEEIKDLASQRDSRNRLPHQYFGKESEAHKIFFKYFSSEI